MLINLIPQPAAEEKYTSASSRLREPDESQAIVFRALRDLIQSDAFRRSARIIRFLEYVVLESLSMTPRLTEKVIGIVVFDRAKDWDPKIDPIVRIEARRLREKLEQYYASVSPDQAVVVSLPKGGYKASFAWHQGPPKGGSKDLEESSDNSPTKTNLDMYARDRAIELAMVSRRPRPFLWFSILCLALGIALTFALLNGSEYRVAEDRDIRIDSLRVDGHLNQELDGLALAGKIADQIRILQQGTRVTWIPPTVEDSWTSQRSSGWPLRFRESLTALTRPNGEPSTSPVGISGSIESSGTSGVRLYIRGVDIEPKTFIGQKDNLPTILLSAAEYIYGSCQPSSYSVYLTEHGRASDAVAFSSLRFPKAQHLGDRIQLLYSWATALSQEGNHREAIEKYELNISLGPQSWGSYAALQSEYEALGETERALDVGHQLEFRAHRGSWWFEHLPPRLFRRPEPDVYMATDELMNDYLALRKSFDIELSSHEGGAELLPLYSSYAQVLSSLHERSNAHLQLDLANNQKDQGATEGNLLYTKVVLAVEEQDDKRLRSILNSYRDQISDAPSRHLLALDTDSICEIMAAYERIGEPQMSDLLSSLSNDSVDCLSKKAEVQLLRGNVSEASNLFQEAIVRAPLLPAPHYDYGLLLITQGDLRRANIELELAHTSGPHWAEPIEKLAALAVHRGDIKAGLDLYRQAARCAPAWGHLFISWADALVRNGNNHEAAAKLRYAYSLNLNATEEADFQRVYSSIHGIHQ